VKQGMDREKLRNRHFATYQVTCLYQLIICIFDQVLWKKKNIYIYSICIEYMHTVIVYREYTLSEKKVAQAETVVLFQKGNNTDHLCTNVYLF